MNPVPVIVTVVPPADGPSVASTFVTVGGASNLYLIVALCGTLASDTSTSSSPAELAAVFAVISVAETTVTDVASPPIVTFAPARKPVPLIFTVVPPAVVPSFGEIEVTVGGVKYV